MTPRTLFSIILKVMGIFFLKDILEIIPQTWPALVYLVKPGIVNEGLVTLASFLLFCMIYGFFAWYMIFKSDLVIEKLKLDKDFDPEPIQFNVHRSTVLNIAIIVIGGVMIVDEIPNFLRQLYRYYQLSRDNYRQSDPTIAYMIVSAAKIIIGFLLIAEKKWIVNFVERQRKK